MAGVGSADNAFAQLNRFEETVSKEEATAKAFDQLASAGKDDDLEAQFAQLGGHSVDAELEALKAERAQTAPPTMPKELAAPERDHHARTRPAKRPTLSVRAGLDRPPNCHAHHHDRSRSGRALRPRSHESLQTNAPRLRRRRPQPDLANLKPTDARTGDVISISGRRRQHDRPRLHRRPLHLVSRRRAATGSKSAARTTSAASPCASPTRKRSKSPLQNDPRKLTLERSRAQRGRSRARWTSARIRPTRSSSTTRLAVPAERRRHAPNATTSRSRRAFITGNSGSRTASACSAVRKPQGEPFAVSMYAGVPVGDVTVYRRSNPMQRPFLKFAAAILGTGLVVVPFLGLDGLPRDLRRQIAAERTALARHRARRSATRRTRSRTTSRPSRTCSARFRPASSGRPRSPTPPPTCSPPRATWSSSPRSRSSNRREDRDRAAALARARDGDPRLRP